MKLSLGFNRYFFQDLEEGAGNQPNAGQNMVYFIMKLRQLVPNIIISQPTYGYPLVTTFSSLSSSFLIRYLFQISDATFPMVLIPVFLIIFEGEGLNIGFQIKSPQVARYNSCFLRYPILNLL